MLGKQYLKYVSSNILGMMGISFYILADTYFVAARLGADGLAALNIAIPGYSLVNATGLMVAMGGAVRYTIAQSQGQKKQAHEIFTKTMLTGWFFAAIYLLMGIFLATPFAALLGAEGEILPMTADYLRMMLLFGVFFISNDMMLAFVRNDGAPRLAMIGMICGSLTNVVLDYVFIFPLDMGLFGAALATGFSPAVSMCVMSIHVWKKKNGFAFCRVKEVAKSGLLFCKLGISAFVNEFATGVVLTVFNLLILSISGNTGVAAYGVIANIALVGTAVYTGLSQGTQPLVSQYYGKRDHHSTRKLYGFAISTALLLGAVMIAIAWVFTEPLVTVFNGEGNETLQTMAEEGLRLYFIGFLFAGINIVSAVYLGAVEQPMPSFIIAMARGVVAILFFAFLLSSLFGMLGIWLAFPAAEGATCLLTAVFMWRSRKGKTKEAV